MATAASSKVDDGIFAVTDTRRRQGHHSQGYLELGTLEKGAEVEPWSMGASPGHRPEPPVTHLLHAALRRRWRACDPEGLSGGRRAHALRLLPTSKG